MQEQVALVILTLSLAARAGAEARIALVRDGTAVAGIVVAERPTRSAQFAAAELQYHIHKISGAKLPIVRGHKAVEGGRVLVGESELTRALGLRASDFQSQEYVIRFLPDTVVLMGRDHEDHGQIDYAKGTGLPDYFENHASVYAVYDFLERCCGVRWYLPTELGLVCPSKRTVIVSGANVRRAPVMKWRTYRYMFPRDYTRALWGDTMRGQRHGPTFSMRDKILWEHRMRLGGERFKAHHSFYGYHNRFFKTHPEWFARGYPERKTPPQMCYSSPDFVQQVIRDARDYFDGKGRQPGAVAEGNYFGLGALDNHLWCKCRRCRARTLIRKAPHFSNRTASDYWWGFVNEVSRAIKRSHPGKFVASLAYSDYALYPSSLRVESNVAVQMCLHTNNWWCPAMERSDLRVLDDWVKDKGRRLYLYLYYEFPWGVAVSRQFRCFPGFSMHTIARQMRLFHERGVRGFYYVPALMAEWQPNPLMDQLSTYVFMKLADDPGLDVDAMLDEFFARYYGAAGEPMKKLVTEIEETYSRPANYPKEVREEDRGFHQTEEIAWQWLGTKERMQTFGELMRQALDAARTDHERQRVRLFEDGVWRYMQAGRELYFEHKGKTRLPPPILRVPRSREPLPEGDVAKVDWSRAAVLGFRTTMGDVCPRKLQARVLHDTKFLYVEFEERGADTRGLVSRDDVWQGDDWEVFFARQRGRPYRQIGINPRGLHIGLDYPEKGERVWPTGATVISELSGDRWAARLAVPLADIAAERWAPGDRLYMNFARVTAKRAVFVWSPTFEPGLHVLSRLGEVRLTEETEAVPGWWQIPGKTCVAAYQAVDVGSFAASLVNMANPDANGLAPVGHPPTWSAPRGWTFSASRSGHFETGTWPRPGYTLAVRYANAASGIPVGADGSGYRDMFVQPTGDRIWWRYGGGQTKWSSPGCTDGVLILAGQTGYRDGAVDIADIAGEWSATGVGWATFFIGARNKMGKPLNSFSGDILAVAIYSDALTADEVAHLTRRMAAISSRTSR